MNTETVDTPARLVQLISGEYIDGSGLAALDELGAVWVFYSEPLIPGTWVRLSATNPPPEKLYATVAADIE